MTAPAKTNEEGKALNAHQLSLPGRLAALCEDEQACLTRSPGKGEVKPRQLDPSEKPRTTGARTAGG